MSDSIGVCFFESKVSFALSFTVVDNCEGRKEAVEVDADFFF